MRGRVNSVTYSSGSNIPDGKTVTPVNDVEIWQKCAGISSPTYTTLAGVLSDNSLLMTLMASDNAVDYLVRSTDWVAPQSAVPIMTSDTTPSGVASASAYYSGRQAFHAFDGSIEGDNNWAVNISGQ